MRTWLRFSLLVVLLAFLGFYDIFFYVFNIGFHAAITTTGTIVFWSVAIVLNIIVCYAFLQLTKDINDNRKIAIFFITLGATLFIIAFMVMPIQLWWVYYPGVGP
jgi:hypothetical protein